MHPGPAGDNVDDRVRDRQERRDHHGGPGELAAPPVHAAHVLGPAIALAGQQRDDALAPEPARPPVEQIEFHQPGDRGEEYHQQRPVPDAGERRGRDDGLGAPIQHFEQHRMGTNQGGTERQQRVVVKSAQRDAGPQQDVDAARPPGPGNPRVIPRPPPVLRSIGLRLRRLRRLLGVPGLGTSADPRLLFHHVNVYRIASNSIFGRTGRGNSSQARSPSPGRRDMPGVRHDDHRDR